MFKRMVLAGLAWIPIKSISYAAEAEIKDLGYSQKRNTTQLSIASFHATILPDRAAKIKIDEAYDRFVGNFEVGDLPQDQIDLLFDRMIEDLIRSKKIRIDSNEFISGNESGVHAE